MGFHTHLVDVRAAILAGKAVKSKKKIDTPAAQGYPPAVSFIRAAVSKMLKIKDLRQVGVVGLGLLGASVTLAVQGALPGVRTVGYGHRAATRRKARAMGVASEVAGRLADCVAGCDLVILATPICTFARLFEQIGPHLKPGAVVTDVGSTKVQPHRWARKALPKGAFYVGSHPIAGSEKRGLEYARDDLFMGARCVLTTDRYTNPRALGLLREFWARLGCTVHIMSPPAHDRILGRVSHLPHVLAAALVNASDAEQLRFAGKGFIDTSRVSSGPANIWADILVTNPTNTVHGVRAVIRELRRLEAAISAGDKAQIEALLANAERKREELIAYKVENKELF